MHGGGNQVAVGNSKEIMHGVGNQVAVGNSEEIMSIPISRFYYCQSIFYSNVSHNLQGPLMYFSDTCIV